MFVSLWLDKIGYLNPQSTTLEAKTIIIISSMSRDGSSYRLVYAAARARQASLFKELVNSLLQAM